MDERRQLIIAYGISTWQNSIDSIHALHRMGEPVPWVMVGRIQSELVDLVWEWPTVDGSVPPEDEIPRVVDEAREYLSGRTVQLSELLSEYGVSEW